MTLPSSLVGLWMGFGAIMPANHGPPPYPPDPPIRVWVTTDPSFGSSFRDVDDLIALLYAFAAPEIDPVGIGVTFGNVEDVPEAVEGVRDMVRRFGPRGLAVLKGAGGPEDLGHPTDASRALAEALQRERLTVLALGPLTPVATMLLRYPALAGRIERLVAVAGRRPGDEFRPGRGGIALRDLNFESDPDAFRVVLRSEVPIVLVPYDAGRRVWVSTSDLEELAEAGPAGSWLAERSRGWMDIWIHLFGVTGFNPFDAVATAYLTDPEQFDCARGVPVAIESGPDDRWWARLLGREKPYLLVSRSISSSVRVTWCPVVDPGIESEIVRSVARLRPIRQRDR